MNEGRVKGSEKKIVWSRWKFYDGPLRKASINHIFVVVASLAAFVCCQYLFL